MPSTATELYRYRSSSMSSTTTNLYHYRSSSTPSTTTELYHEYYTELHHHRSSSMRSPATELHHCSSSLMPSTTTYQISRLCWVFPVLLVLLTFTLLKGRSREVQTESSATKIPAQPVCHFIATVKGGQCVCLHSANHHQIQLMLILLTSRNRFWGLLVLPKTLHNKISCPFLDH